MRFITLEERKEKNKKKEGEREQWLIGGTQLAMVGICT